MSRDLGIVEVGRLGSQSDGVLDRRVRWCPGEEPKRSERVCMCGGDRNETSKKVQERNRESLGTFNVRVDTLIPMEVQEGRGE